MKYVITNGEFYVKRDHVRNKYIRDNRKSEATQFTSKQAKHILGLKHKYTWIKDGFYFEGENTRHFSDEMNRRLNG